MNGLKGILGIFVALEIAVAATTLRADSLTPAEKAHLMALDAGPKKIDISKYPAGQKAAYSLFAKKCVKCHSLGRAINTGFSLPDEWQRYIKRMMYKPNSNLSEQDAKAIYRFLVYDSSVRKPDTLSVHLALLPAHERQEELERIKALNPAFNPK